MRTVVKCLNWLDQHIEFWLGFFLYAYLAGIIVVEVFRRYVLNAASTWGEETAIYAFIWLSYIAAAKGVRSRRHLAVDTLRDRMPRIGQFCAYVLSDSMFFHACRDRRVLLAFAYLAQHQVRPAHAGRRYSDGLRDRGCLVRLVVDRDSRGPAVCRSGQAFQCGKAPRGSGRAW